MTDVNNGVPLRHGNRVFSIAPDFTLVREIEQELGALPALLEKLAQARFSVTELVSLVHMMLAAAGETTDYHALGNLMLKAGLKVYLAAATALLTQVLHGA